MKCKKLFLAVIERFLVRVSQMRHVVHVTLHLKRFALNAITLFVKNIRTTSIQKTLVFEVILFQS